MTREIQPLERSRNWSRQTRCRIITNRLKGDSAKSLAASRDPAATTLDDKIHGRLWILCGERVMAFAILDDDRDPPADFLVLLLGGTVNGLVSTRSDCFVSTGK